MGTHVEKSVSALPSAAASALVQRPEKCDEIWLIDVVAPFGGIPMIMEALRSEALSGQVIHQLAPPARGPSRVVSWPPA
ncbi:toxin-activating lysine-acyltransferase [Hydrogenophaga palleronii]|uniref:toxin-activating lysine-acyltransferase n=1 Tax=Hydrogenophaga palleronii TaxID=65655 RepID=UPI003860253D